MYHIRLISWKQILFIKMSIIGVHIIVEGVGDTGWVEFQLRVTFSAWAEALAESGDFI